MSVYICVGMCVNMFLSVCDYASQQTPQEMEEEMIVPNFFRSTRIVLITKPERDTQLRERE